MSLRSPEFLSRSPASNAAFDALSHEIVAETASSLGRAGRRVEESLAELRACPADASERVERLKRAAEAVHAYFIQREICGLRRHQDVIREYGIPRQVLVRLGAS
ncbi:DUF6665 family protein [Aquamicrobium sp. LC103]|uniref:DUF6665 family protein n=1 Tax=Aquamicrobium sp. LC103 TaxID=1120658 RepID=UPI00063EC2A1|nr:DUF6665 family protein [Aquamicrobium sp. LC103]TKT77348.1 hypothetical protein XW59_012790 [Aquamicrobium sp. LC103]